MNTYVMLSRLTPKGRETLHKNPDRTARVNKEIEELGCKVLAQWAVLGNYDFVTIIQAPDNETVAHLAVDLGARGTMHMETLPAISTIVFRKKLKDAKPIDRPRRDRKKGTPAKRRRRAR